MECQCGCGESVPRASFKPGHDQKLRISLERRVGGIEGLRDLIDAAERYASGQSSSDALAGSVRAIFGKSGEAEPVRRSNHKQPS